MKNNSTPRERWDAALNGGSCEGMVSPLCDDWCFSDIPYYWPFDEADPFPPGHAYHSLSRQMAMGGVCGWDSTFVTAIQFKPTSKTPVWKSKTYNKDGSPNSFTESQIETPYGNLTHVVENSPASHRVVEQWVNTREDYRRLIWYLDRAFDIDMDAAIADGKMLRAAAGNKGLLGTWVPPVYNVFCNTQNMFYHLMDWPDEYEAFLEASLRYTLNMLDVYAKADFDYIFYMIPGTEWVSPGFYEQYVHESSKKIMSRWRSYGKKVMIHSCGHMKLFIENGYFNELMPDIFETLSTPPVGNVPDLKWGRERLHKDIITKGNLELDIMLEGSEEDVRNGVRRIKEQARGTRHVVGLSDNLLPGTPLANCLAFTEESRRV